MKPYMPPNMPANMPPNMPANMPPNLQPNMPTDASTSALEQGFTIGKEQRADFAHVEKLYDVCFGGASRLQRPIYQLRDRVLPLEPLCFVLRQEQASAEDMGQGESKQGESKQGNNLQGNSLAMQPSTRVVAALRFWNVRIVTRGVARSVAKSVAQSGENEKSALLFGPLAVATAMQGKGFGKKLIEHGIAEARRLGHGGILISGVCAYYRPFGFKTSCVSSIVMPHPSPGHMIMGLELRQNYLLSARGKVLRARQ